MDQHAFRILGLDTSFETIDAPRTRAMISERIPADRTPTQRKENFTSNHHPSTSSVNVRLADLLPLLLDAMQKNRAWIKDFDEDLISVPQDLYEVALAYRSMGRAA
jgi:hypothetical protein